MCGDGAYARLDGAESRHHTKFSLLVFRGDVGIGVFVGVGDAGLMRLVLHFI